VLPKRAWWCELDKRLKGFGRSGRAGSSIVVIGTVFAVIGPLLRCKKYAPVLLLCKLIHCYLLQYRGIMYRRLLYLTQPNNNAFETGSDISYTTTGVLTTPVFRELKIAIIPKLP
jgi:hypothetical protein